jgi:hypothetical protein
VEDQVTRSVTTGGQSSLSCAGDSRRRRFCVNHPGSGRQGGEQDKGVLHVAPPTAFNSREPATLAGRLPDEKYSRSKQDLPRRNRS